MALSRWPVNVADVQDNHAFRSLAQKVHRYGHCVTRSAILLESHTIGIHVTRIRLQNIACRRSIAHNSIQSLSRTKVKFS